MSTLVRHAACVLAVTFAISVVYELWRATAKAGTSRHDTLSNLLWGLVLYAVSAAVIVALFLSVGWAPWAGLVLSVGWILNSIFYYNPTIMLERQPGVVDWIEDLVFTGLLFVAATLLLYEVLGMELVS
jgi:hypothetical protein